MGLPIVVSKVLAAASATAVCASQTPLAGGNLTINGGAASGGVATLDTQRQVLFTFAASEVGRTFVIYGTNQYGNAIQESVAGAAATAVTTKDYKTVTRITIDAASAGAITVGTNGVGGTPWISLSPFLSPSNTAIGVVVTGTVNFTVNYTYDADPCGIINTSPAVAVPTAWSLTALAAKTATTDTLLTSPVTAVQLVMNSGTGTCTMTVLPAGQSSPY